MRAPAGQPAAPAAARAYDVLVVAPNAAVDTYYELEDIRPGQVNRIQSVRDTAGGKGNNLARALMRLGGRPLVIGIAAGRRGDFILDHLTREGIAYDYVMAEGNSRLNTTLLSTHLGQATVLLEPGLTVTTEALEVLAGKVAAWMARIDYVVLTGSLPPGGPTDYYARLIRQARPTHPLVAVDASGEALRLAAWAGPTLIKVNREEFESAFPGAASDWPRLAEQYRQLAASGLETLVLTDGARGAVVLSAREQFWVRTVVPRWVSNVGAGDTFLAGLLFALRRGDSLRDAARLASAAAASNLQVFGCGDIEMAAVDRYLLDTHLSAAPDFLEARL